MTLCESLKVPVNVCALWPYGYTDKPFAIGTAVDGTAATCTPYNQVNHESTIGGRGFLDQVITAFVSRRSRINDLVFHGGSLHSAAGTTDSDLDDFTEVAIAVNARMSNDVQSALDFTLSSPHKLAVQRYYDTTRREVYGEPWRGVTANDAKADGWDFYTAGYLIERSYAVSSLSGAKPISSVLADGNRILIEADGSSSNAEQLAGVGLWMGTYRCDYGCDMAARSTPEKTAILTAAKVYC